MIWRSIVYGTLGLTLEAWLWMTPTSAWAGTSRRAPNAARLQMAEQLKQVYERLYTEDKYAEAAQQAKRACEILEEELGCDSAEFAGCINDLGVFLKNQGQYREA